MSPLTDDNLADIERALLDDGREHASREEVSAMLAEIRRYRYAASCSTGGDLSEDEMVLLEDSVMVSGDRTTPLGSAVVAAVSEIRRRRMESAVAGGPGAAHPELVPAPYVTGR